jgi:hypothetical protein
MFREHQTGKFLYPQKIFLDLAIKEIMIETIPVDVTYNKKRRSRVADKIFQYLHQPLNIILRPYRDHHPLRFFVLLGDIHIVIGSICELFTHIHY